MDTLLDTLSVLRTLVCLDTHFLSVQETLDKTWSVHKTDTYLLGHQVV